MKTISDILQTSDSKLNFMRAIIRVAKCDKVITEEEKALVKESVDAIALPETYKNIIDETWDEDQISIHFETTKEKLYTLIQLVQLAWVDGNYALKEKEEIHLIAQEIGISLQSIDIIEQWVHEGIIWANKGEKLLDLE